MSQLPSKSEQGFTLIELMIAMVVIVIGVLGVASTTVSMTRTQDLTAARVDMAALADNKFEQLRGFASAKALVTADTAQLTLGGSLTVATAGYNDVVVERGRSYSRLWVVTAGVGGTRDVTIRITPLTGNRPPAPKDFRTLITIACGVGTC
jgi:prepilin-type N-terminal cleavage/methylation domain-containing protein